MSTLIAVTGKGGVGKTTVAALTIQQLVARGCAPVLAVDADPNTCLDRALGLSVEATIGGVREEARQIASQGLAAGVSKQELLELRIAESLVEGPQVDLIAMGRPEGPGCYCYANNVLKSALGQVTNSYPYVVLDNEAGLENLSRRIVQRVDVMLMVSDPSRAGLDTVVRLHGLAREMGIEYGRLSVVVNRLRREALPAHAAAVQAATHADDIIGLPDDQELAARAEAGDSLMGLAGDNPAAIRLGALLEQAELRVAVPQP